MLSVLRRSADVLQPLEQPFPPVGRDRNDDFLIAHGVLARADFLVSWDKDLTELGEIEAMRIVTPAEFLAVLREQGLL